ncbi:MAG: GTPase [Rhodospirillaceae bacterium]|jgi:GTP-binding protein Era|nr:GTPase [Rhodospirillaceae bacterium]
MTDQAMTAPRTRSGFAAIVGAPNAGKSTLVNALVGSKVSIVSPKVQTTRMRVIGIAMTDLPDDGEGGARAQVVLVDTPGIFRIAKRRLERAMVAAAWQGAADADLVALVVDAERGVGAETAAIVERLKEQRVPRFLILNKIDLVAREKLLALTAELNNSLPFERTFMVSALKQDGVTDVLTTLAAALPEGPFLYPEDQAADLPLRLLAAEVTREQVFLQLHQELPYEAAVETEKWEDRPDGSVRIEQTIHVQRDGQRAIFLGKGGARIKQIGARARHELGQMLERPVHLFLHVKVSERWADDPAHYRAIGLDYEPKSS